MEQNKKEKTGSLKNWIREYRWYLLVLGFLVFASYANSLSNGFVADDRGIVLHIGSFETIADNPNTFLRTFLYFVTYNITGLSPLFLRLPGIFFHLGVVWLTFYFLSRTTNLMLALFAGALFAVHPILVESVSWISGGVYVQYSFFFLLSFVLYVFGKNDKKRYIFSLVFFVLMLVTSEKSMALALVFLLYEFCFEGLRANWKKTLPYLSFSAVSFLFNFAQIGQRRVYFTSDAPADQIIMNPLAQIPIAITSYLELIFWPNKLTLYHTEMIFTQVEFVIRAVIFALFLVLMVYCFRKNRMLFFWFAFLFVYLSLTLTPLGITWIVAERYVYLGALGIFIPVAWVFAKAMEYKRLKTAVIAVFVVIIVGLSIRTMTRNVDWYNEDNLWLAAARTSPSSSQNHNNLGDYYGRHKDFESAEREFKIAIELKPNYADAYHNLGNLYRETGRLDEAIVQYEKALSFNPRLWQSYQNISIIYYEQEKFEKAKEYIGKGVAIDAKNPNLVLIQGLIYVKTNEKDKARELLLQILQIDPTNQLAKQGLEELEKTEDVKENR